jgi:hypothetical protein
MRCLADNASRLLSKLLYWSETVVFGIGLIDSAVSSSYDDSLSRVETHITSILGDEDSVLTIRQ